MTIGQFGITQYFQGPAEIESYGTGRYAVYDQQTQAISTVTSSGTRTALTGGLGYGYGLEVLSDGAFAVYGLADYGLGRGAAVRVVNAEGSARTGFLNVSNGEDFIGGVALSATTAGGFAIGASSYTAFNQPSTISYPYNSSNMSSSATAGRGGDAALGFFDGSGTGGSYFITNTGGWSYNGASAPATFFDQRVDAVLGLANGSTAEIFLDKIGVGIPAENGGGYNAQSIISLRIVSADGTVGNNIQVNTEGATNDIFSPATYAVAGAGGEQVVSLGSQGFAVVWHEGSYVADSSQYGGYRFDGYDTKIRYFDNSGNALTDEVQIVHRSADVGNLTISAGIDTLGDGRIALVFQDGVYGVNGSAAGQLFVSILGTLGSTIETTAITPPPVQGRAFYELDLASLGNGSFAVSYSGPDDPYTPGTTRVVTFGTGRGITGHDYAETLTGGNGPDTINGLGGNDLLSGGFGSDTLDGGTGNDTLRGGEGYDSLLGGADNDDFYGGLGADAHVGGDGIDYARYDDANYGNLVISLADPSGNTGAAAGDTYVGIEGVYGGAGGDTITGDAVRNLLYGGGANDVLRGGEGNDLLSGDAGFDTLAGGAGADELNGGAGIDYAAYDDADWGNLLIRLDAPSLSTGAAAGDTYISIEGVIGGLGNDTIYGAATLDTLLGGGGDDFLYGGAGNDSLIGGDGGDRLAGGAGADRLVGGGGTGVDYASYEDANWGNLVISLADATVNTGAAAGDTYNTIEGIIGGRGNDTIYGDAVRNYLYGRSGNDTLDGGLGNDSLSGQVGADSFQFTTALGRTNVDTINDFTHGEDKILLSQAIFAGIGGTLDANEFGTAGPSTLIVYNQTTGQLSYDASGSGSGASAVLFAKVAAGTVLDINDFLMIV